MSIVIHFEIPADNLERAKKFSSELFGWEIVEIIKTWVLSCHGYLSSGCPGRCFRLPRTLTWGLLTTSSTLDSLYLLSPDLNTQGSLISILYKNVNSSGRVCQSRKGLNLLKPKSSDKYWIKYS
jgi:hypothetical protein